MIEQKLKTYFNRYSAISPRADFSSRSKSEIIKLPQIARSWHQKVFETLTAGGALALASMLILAVVGGVSYVSRDGNAGGSLSNASLNVESKNLTFGIKLQEVKYFDETASQMVQALEYIAEGETKF